MGIKNQIYVTDEKSVPKNMETKYLGILTFIFWKKSIFFIKKKNTTWRALLPFWK